MDCSHIVVWADTQDNLIFVLHSQPDMINLGLNCYNVRATDHG